MVGPRRLKRLSLSFAECQSLEAAALGRGDDTVGNPHRARIFKLELFERILLWRLFNYFPVEQFEATVSQSTVPPPVLGPAGTDPEDAAEVGVPLFGPLKPAGPEL